MNTRVIGTRSRFVIHFNSINQTLLEISIRRETLPQGNTENASSRHLPASSG